MIPSRLVLSFHNLDLIFRQPIQRVHQLVDVLVCRVDLALNCGLFVVGFGGSEILVQVQRSKCVVRLIGASLGTFVMSFLGRTTFLCKKMLLQVVE